MDSLISLRPMEARTLRENVTDILRRAIIDGSLAPGSELNQAQMAEKLGISRGPLREALGQLEQEGLIRNVPYKGVYVTSLSKKYVEELYSIRAVLESFALSRAMSRQTADDIKILKQTVEEMGEAARAQASEPLVEFDRRFHRHLVTMAEHDLLLDIWSRLEIGVLRCLHTRHRIYRDLEEVVGSHPALIEAMEAGNVLLAKQILHDHILEAGEQICKHWPDEADNEPDGASEESTNRDKG